MSERKPKGRVPDLLVERLAAGELAEEERRAVRARLEAEEGGLARLDALARSNEEVLAAYPPGQVVRDIEDRVRVEGAAAREPAKKPAWWMGLPVAAAAAAALLVVVLPSEPDETALPADETILLKGAEPRLRVFVREPSAARAVDEGEPLPSGAVVQLGYVAAGKAYGVIASVDGRGGVTLHLPSSPGPAAALEAGGLVRLPSAFELDDAPGFERFFFVTAAAPFETSVVEEAARSLVARGDAEEGALPLPAEMSVVAFRVQKDAAAIER